MINKTTIFFMFLASCSCVTQVPIRPIKQYKHFAGTCAVRCFDFNQLKVVSDSFCGDNFKTDLRRPAIECDGLLGVDIDVYATDIKPKALEAIQECKDLAD